MRVFGLFLQVHDHRANLVGLGEPLSAGPALSAAHLGPKGVTEPVVTMKLTPCVLAFFFFFLSENSVLILTYMEEGMRTPPVFPNDLV